MTDETKTLEDMSTPCSYDLCDGSGKIDDGERIRDCLCEVDRKDVDEYDPVRDY